MTAKKTFTIRSLVAALLVAVAASSASAITLVNSGQFGGSNYRVYTQDGISWEESNAAALALGSGWRLVSVTSAAENNFVESLLSGVAGNRNHFFIGLLKNETSGVLEWTSGEAYGFSDWHSGEPNSTGERFVAYDYRSGWKWNDIPNDSHPQLQKGFIAERVPDAGTTVGLLFSSLLAVGFLRRRLK